VSDGRGRTPSVGDPAAVLAAIDPALRDRPLTRLGEGWDNVVHAVGDDLVLRIVKDPDPRDHAGHVAREVALLDLAARVCPVAVGEVVATHPEAGALLCRRVPGVAFDDLSEADQARFAVPVAEQVAVAITAVHALPLDRVPTEVEPPTPLAEWRAELAEEVDEVRAGLAPDLAAAIDRLLAAPAPADPPIRSLCHNDLGGEHVMVDPARGAVTGIIDWTDAVRADPIRDLALLLADLGEEAFAAAVAVHPGPFDDADLARARWYAAHALAGTLAYFLVRADAAGVALTERRLRRLADPTGGV
jgi:aminoglycoside phosphotransferase (APT) family kinase protein